MSLDLALGHFQRLLTDGWSSDATLRAVATPGSILAMVKTAMSPEQVRQRIEQAAQKKVDDLYSQLTIVGFLKSLFSHRFNPFAAYQTYRIIKQQYEQADLELKSARTDLTRALQATQKLVFTTKVVESFGQFSGRMAATALLYRAAKSPMSKLAGGPIATAIRVGSLGRIPSVVAIPMGNYIAGAIIPRVLVGLVSLRITLIDTAEGAVEAIADMERRFPGALEKFPPELQEKVRAKLGSTSGTSSSSSSSSQVGAGVARSTAPAAATSRP